MTAQQLGDLIHEPGIESVGTLPWFPAPLPNEPSCLVARRPLLHALRHAYLHAHGVAAPSSIVGPRGHTYAARAGKIDYAVAMFAHRRSVHGKRDLFVRSAGGV